MQKINTCNNDQYCQKNISSKWANHDVLFYQCRTKDFFTFHFTIRHFIRF